MTTSQRCVVLGNIDYQRHMTDEGNQLQLGLQHAGWKLVGAGYEDGCRHVPTLLERYKPRIVLVHDKRDWDATQHGCWDKNIEFQGVEVLADHPEIYKISVFKDAATFSEYHRVHANQIKADALLIYYSPHIVTKLAPWVKDFRLVRTWHTVDADVVRALDLNRQRRNLVVSGAMGGEHYPFRTWCKENKKFVGTEVLDHPRYGNNGCDTPKYLQRLAGYKVHIATASRYMFALRKIIESVAVGCTPLTNLPHEDALPEIDGALVRVQGDNPGQHALPTIWQSVREWSLEERLEWSRKCLEWYDYRAMGLRTSEELCKEVA